MMERKKALFFDWDGTLSLSRFWQQLEDPSHENHSLAPYIQEYLFSKNKELVRDWMVGNLNSEDISKKLSQVLNVDQNIILEELKISCNSMKLVSNNVLAIVDDIRNRVITAIATDNMDTFTRWTAPSMNLAKHFDGILNSFDLGTSKRNVHAFFEDFLEQFGVNPSDCTIIDDSEDKNGAMTNYGFRYVKINRGELIPNLELLIREL